jgi:hypothetical protein
MTPAPPEGDLEQGGNPVTNPTGLCKCGCGQRTNAPRWNSAARGHVAGQPFDYIQGHNGRKYADEWIVEDHGYATPCWIWLGRTDPHGYGRMKTKTIAHRWTYEQANGPLGPKMHLHHLCEQPSCVNPDHLEPTTMREHRRRHAKLTPEQVEEIRRATTTQKVAAALYGVSEGHIGTIRRGESWA